MPIDTVKRKNITDKDLSKIFVDFIDIVFAIIVSMGFTFFIDYLKNISLTSANIIVFSLFLSTYFFIISDWIFYHELLCKYPYTEYTRFFIDILVFFLMFLLTYSAMAVTTTKSLVIYIANVAVWHLSVIAWHISAKKEKEYKNMKKEIDKSIKAHTIRFVLYTLIGISYFIVSQFIVNEIITYLTVAVVVILIWYFNLKRLNYFKCEFPTA